MGLPLSVLAEGEGAARATPVTTVRVEAADLREVTHVRASIESVNAPTLHGKVAAEVVEILVDEGDPVKRGQVLARLDDEGFRLDKEAAEADIARLEATLANQLLTLERDRKLFKKGLIPDDKLDASRTAVKQTRASIVHAKALLKKAEYQLSHTVIEAPLDGIVQARMVSVGDYINPMSPASKPLFQIVDTRHLRARLYFPDILAARLRPGLPVTLIQGADRVETRISQLLPMIDDASLAKIALADFDNVRNWPPGLHISADVVLSEHHGVPAVPEGVLVRRPSGLVVYRLAADGETVREVRVKVGIHEGGRVEIIDGLRPGDEVVLDGAAYLSDGVKVAPTTATEPAR
ncbi:MAG: efflux RND transporter periplasmic adaptor subunit [Gammaproteobacteria bacterium]|nr:MAG: efflux RND transporter periplasmic adaptor subunit [Gammaproteobacteria bacterium]